MAIVVEAHIGGIRDESSSRGRGWAEISAPVSGPYEHAAVGSPHGDRTCDLSHTLTGRVHVDSSGQEGLQKSTFASSPAAPSGYCRPRSRIEGGLGRGSHSTRKGCQFARGDCAARYALRWYESLTPSCPRIFSTIGERSELALTMCIHAVRLPPQTADGAGPTWQGA